VVPTWPKVTAVIELNVIVTSAVRKTPGMFSAFLIIVSLFIIRLVKDEGYCCILVFASEIKCPFKMWLGHYSDDLRHADGRGTMMTRPF
jgi:hypothetical protein